VNKNYLLKAERRLETAKFAFEKGYICSAVSNCYYALFNLMQAVVGEAEKKRWEHGGLPKIFAKTVFHKRLLPPEEIKGIVKFSERLYGLRRKADYSSEIMENSEDAKQSLLFYISKIESLLNRLKEIPDDTCKS
jgi:uncharacterized protein (UPF0332 family)